MHLFETHIHCRNCGLPINLVFTTREGISTHRKHYLAARLNSGTAGLCEECKNDWLAEHRDLDQRGRR